MFGLFSQNFVLLIAFGSSSPASSSVFALYRECSEISFQRCPTRTLFIRIFRVLNTVQSFIFKVHVVAVFSGNAQYLITLFSLCQQLFQFLFGNLFDFLPRSHGARIIISNVTAKVNSIFQLFSFFYFSQKTAAIQRNYRACSAAINGAAISFTPCGFLAFHSAKLTPAAATALPRESRKSGI